MVKKNNRVLLGLSGGVDSTAAALLLKEKGFDVTGYYFDVTGKNREGLKEAEETAKQLEIELITEDVSEEFSSKIIKYFCNEYMNGRTPNPCIMCNPEIKFRKLLQKADERNIFHIATGHYSRIFFDRKNDAYFVRKGANLKKDQSYMLYRLGQNVLSRVIFPLGEFSDKEQIRNIVKEKKIKNADKKDSQEICFISGDYKSYIKKMGYIPEKGVFKDKKGNILGENEGIINYTVGQRKGLGIALGKPAFVVKIDPDENSVTLGEDKDLLKKEVICEDCFFAADNPENYEDVPLKIKIRYSASEADGYIKVYDKKIIAIFKAAQRAMTPGQSAVFYHEDIVIGGGIIK